jgi:hypothetical protein
MRALRVVESDAAVYPLPAGAMVGSLEHFPFWGHRFAGSRLRLTASNEAIGAALCLWVGALSTQAPAGTLPQDDAQIAVMANYARDPAGFRAVREDVLRGWAAVRVLGEGGEDHGLRLAHPVVTEVAVYLWGLRSKVVAKRAQDGRRQKLGRLRQTIREVGSSRAAENADTVAWVEQWLRARGLPQTKVDVRAALIAHSAEVSMT